MMTWKPIALALVLTEAVACPQALAGGPLTLKERRRLETPSPLSRAIYVRPSGFELLSAGGLSTDNGRTWQPMTPRPDFAAGLPAGYRREPLIPWLDPGTGKLLVIVNAMDTPGLDPNVIEPPVSLETYYLRYRVSTDAGRSWLFDETIVQEGDYSPRHPIDGVFIGKNAIFMGDEGSRPILNARGEILVPAQRTVLGADGKITSPGGGFTWTDAVILIGTWKEDHRVRWRLGRPILADPKRSTRGMIEPTLARMPDGRILCVLRGSNGGSLDPRFQLPGHKWFSISTDGGDTWTSPEPWTYSDGGTLYSPSSMSQLLSHSNGRTYWIGNVSPTNPKGNSPRSPLVAGEVDPKTFMLIRESVLVLDDRGPEDSTGVELCAHTAAFEDRQTGDFVLPMLRFTAGYKSSAPSLIRIGTGE